MANGIREVAGTPVFCEHPSLWKRGQVEKGWPITARREGNNFPQIRRSLKAERKGGFPPVMRSQWQGPGDCWVVCVINLRMLTPGLWAHGLPQNRLGPAGLKGKHLCALCQPVWSAARVAPGCPDTRALA